MSDDAAECRTAEAEDWCISLKQALQEGGTQSGNGRPAGQLLEVRCVWHVRPFRPSNKE
jgi:hypothetical protein